LTVGQLGRDKLEKDNNNRNFIKLVIKSEVS
jgi:hypothetical protein